jgi:putative membrane protein
MALGDPRAEDHQMMGEILIGTNASAELARLRTREAADRTLLAWIRTSLFLIAFGFAVAKAHDCLQTVHLKQSVDPIHSMLNFGVSFIALGILSLLVAIIQ